MTDWNGAELRRGLEVLLRAATDGHAVYLSLPSPVQNAFEQTTLMFRPTAPDAPSLDPAKLLAMRVLLGEPDSVIASALADMLLDMGHEYATAVAEKARKDERERIAERLYGEASHALSRPGDPDTNELVAAALSSVADDLTFGVPPTAPRTTPE